MKILVLDVLIFGALVACHSGPIKERSPIDSEPDVKALELEIVGESEIEDEPEIWDKLSLSDASLETLVRVYYTKTGEVTKSGKVTWGKTSTGSIKREVGFRPEYGPYYQIICEPGTKVSAFVYVYNNEQRTLTSFGNMSEWSSKGAKFISSATCPQGKHTISKNLYGMIDDQGHSHRFKGIVTIEGR